MSGEQVLRVILVKQLGGFSNDELAFHLADSISYRALIAADRVIAAFTATYADLLPAETHGACAPRAAVLSKEVSDE